MYCTVTNDVGGARHGASWEAIIECCVTSITQQLQLAGWCSTTYMRCRVGHQDAAQDGDVAARTTEDGGALRARSRVRAAI